MKKWIIRGMDEPVEVISFSGNSNRRDRETDYVNYIDSEGKEHHVVGFNYYYDFIEIDNDERESLRNQAAIQFISSIIESESSWSQKVVGETMYRQVVKHGVNLANELIKQLYDKD